MRHLISTLQTHNQQMKGEVLKYKMRLREAQTELNQVTGHMEAPGRPDGGATGSHLMLRSLSFA